MRTIHKKMIWRNLIVIMTDSYPFHTPTDLYGMFQIKAWTIPFWILRVERVIICHTSDIDVLLMLLLL